MRRAPVLRKNLALARSLTGPRDKTIRLTFIQTSLPERSGRNRGIRVRGGDELGQIGTNEFFPQLIRLAANEKHLQSRPYSNQILGRAIKVQRLLNSSWPSRGDLFPLVLVMESAENHASHNLAVLGRNVCRDLAAVGIPRHVQESPVRGSNEGALGCNQ